MITLRYTLDEKQEKLLSLRVCRKMLKLCPQEVLQARVKDIKNEGDLCNLVKKYDLADVCDFSGLHISASKMLANHLITVMFKYPLLRGRLNFVGSFKGYCNILEKLINLDQTTIKALGMQHIFNSYSIKSVASSLKELLDSPSGAGGNVLAQAISSGGILDGIMLDDRDFNNKAFYFIKNNLKRNVENKNFPQCCDTVDSVVFHEIGHVLDYLCDISNDTKLLSEFHSYTKEQIKNGLSQYASTSVEEYIAEGFSEYMSNPTPRKMAKDVVTHINACYKKLK